MIRRAEGLLSVSGMVMLTCSTVLATDLNVSVTSGGSEMVIVEPCGETVTYDVMGVLSDTENEGLAGFRFGLSFDGGPLDPAETPVADPMLRFAPPDGISAPGGFGGTVVDARLIDVGGAQNTIKNTSDHAPSPLGEVLPDVGHTEIVLVTGSFEAPAEPGTYTLSLSNVSATVIKQGEDGSGVVWATEPAGVGTITSLTVIVPPSEPPPIASNSGPVCSGDEVTLFGIPDGMTSYLWTGPTGFTSAQQNPTVSPARRGTYTLTVTDADNCTGVDRTTVDVLPASCEPWIDCNTNYSHDACDLALGTSEDCNRNDILDECDISAGTSRDCDGNSVPDGCQPDSDGDGVIDACECPAATSGTFTLPASPMTDAGQPHAINDSNTRQGYQVFNASGGPIGATNLFCWSLVETAADGCGNFIASVEDIPSEPGGYEVTLDRPLQPGSITTITYGWGTGSTSGVFTALPGDVHGNGETNTADIGALIGCLDTETCDPWQCDIDRLGGCTGADLERLIDLLNDAGQFSGWNGATPAPNACPPS